MNHPTLIDSIALLTAYVAQAHQRQQQGLPIDTTLLMQTEAMLQRLTIMATVPPLVTV